MALLGLLLGAVQPALLVGIFSCLEGNALALESAEDVVRTVVGSEIGLFDAEGGLLVAEVAVGGVKGFASGADESGFFAGTCVVGEDTVGDGPDAEGIEAAVDKIADGGRKISLEVVDLVG